MNQDRFTGNWKQLKGRVTEHWSKLANYRLGVAAGTRDQLAGKIQERYGISKEQAARQLKEFFDRNRNWDTTNR